MSTSSYKNILFEELGGENKGIGLVTFNRPKALNALNRETLEELNDVLGTVKESHSTKILVLTGAGEKAFVAGADISQFSKMSSNEAIEFATFGQSVFNRLEKIPQPVIAAVNGFALGGGCELAAACDFIYAAATAKFGQPEVNLGIIPGYGGTQRFVRLVGKARAKELIYTGKIFGADEAFRLGLVNKVCEPKQLLNDVYKTGRLIMKKGPLAVAESKRAINEGYDIKLSEALAIECDAFSKTFDSEDQKEGTSAFLEKREPKFVGR